MKDKTIIQISDTHLTPDGEKPSFNQQLNPYNKLSLVFGDLKKMDTKPDLIVLTGDLIHEGKSSDYVRLQEILHAKEQELGVSICVLLGNHDRTAAFYEGFLHKEAQEKYYYKVTIDGVDNYFLDTTFGNIEQGYLDKKQLAWLEKNLAEHAKRPALIFMHHPIAGASLRYMRFSVLQNGAELLDACQKGNVKGIFAGHIHFPTTYATAGIINAVAESTAYHIDCRSYKKHEVSDVVGYNIITLSTAGEIGVENRYLYWGQEIVKEISVDQTDFVDPQIFKK
ncbi:metallophosphoesterase [Liquorilactobacillus satsumensis]|uniref:metallophosphoesterase family protein n=2 Tax=Liquorilactobacillus satsumensis TaxID=259059 RepID=UPI0021C3141A|nr:metallophosphoesterase [Liquorilactobacillus satsumensis]MCP9313124.1 metallophosphoesterase [Liquorilactobacillus satsumensis]MCP9359308.1 metallophosphoesterase [Liquorilactobacillus satsumensis]